MQQLLTFYKEMVKIRRFEEAAAKAYAVGKIKGFCHLYTGQESVAVGSIAAIEPQDYVLATYREHGHALAKGMHPNVVMAELFGKKTGCSQGLGGSMHLFDIEKRFMGGHGIVGAHVPLASGIAFASKYKKEKEVTLCFLGEGAINIGGFHEGMIHAALWNLPAIFIIENNLYAMGTPLHRSHPIKDLTKKAEGYNMNRMKIDAEDVEEVYSTVKKAVDLARTKNKPTLIEMVTYRFRGHSMSDPAKYRPKNELEDKKLKDPISVCYKKLIKMGFDESELKQIEEETKKVIKDSIQFAEESEQLEESAIYNNIFKVANT